MKVPTDIPAGLEPHSVSNLTMRNTLTSGVEWFKRVDPGGQMISLHYLMQGIHYAGILENFGKGCSGFCMR